MALSAVLISCAVAERSGAPTAGPDSTALRGDHFRLILHFRSPEGARQGLQAAEAAWPHVIELFGAGAGPSGLEQPLDIHIHRTAAAYKRVERSLTGGSFRRNLGFSHRPTLTAHVALQPELSEEAMAILGLPPQTLRLVAHEAAHLATFLATENSAWFPDWLDEGVATWVEQRVVTALGLSPPEEAEDPWTATYYWRLSRLLGRGGLPAAADILRGRMRRLETVERYAVQAVFFSFLQTEAYRSRLAAIIREARELRSGPEFAESFLRRAEGILGASGREALERDFRNHVASLRPRWVERRRSLECGGHDWLQIAFPRTDAVAYRAMPVERLEYRIAGSVEILPNPGDRMFLIVGRPGAGSARIEFRAGYGVRVFRMRGESGESSRRSARAIAAARSGFVVREQPIDFEVLVSEGRIRVFVENKELIDARVRDLDLGATWGLGAGKASAGIWRSLTIEPAEPGRRYPGWSAGKAAIPSRLPPSPSIPSGVER